MADGRRRLAASAPGAGARDHGGQSFPPGHQRAVRLAEQHRFLGDDRLGEQTLAAGHTLRIRLGRSRECDYDVQAVYDDASREELHAADLCRTHGLTFDGSAATAAPNVVATHEITLANRSPRPIQQVLISPSEAGDWGDDRLGSRSLSVGDTAAVRYQGDCVADIRVVFDNRGAEERRGVDLCTARRIAIQPGWVTANAIPTELQPGADMVQLTVVNRSGHTATGLFLFPQGSADRGPDLLGGTALDEQARLAITFQRPAATCGFTARVVFSGKLPDRDVPGLDLCRSQDVVLPPRG
jgi:hypothetical protein